MMKWESADIGRRCAVGLGAAGLLPWRAAAQDYPTRPISIVVPYGPGSFTDNAARPIAQGLQELLGQPVIIDNRAGAAGVVGTQYLTRARPDGYTLLVGSSTTMAGNMGLFRALPYDPRTDFAPIAGFASTAFLFVTRADFPARDMPGFIEHARRQREGVPVAYGSSSAQVALAQFRQVSAANILAVPYRDTPLTITDLLGGQIAMGVIDVGNGVPLVRSGRLNALAVSSRGRSSQLPEVPTLAETWPGTELVTWIGLVAPTGTPAPVLERLEGAVGRLVAQPEFRQRLATIGAEVDPAGRAELARWMERDQRQWLELIRLAGIEPQ